MDASADNEAVTCLALAREVCVSWSASFPFWEVAVSLLATGIVTFFTIWFSVRTARQETARQLERDAANRAEEARRASEAAEIQRSKASHALRVRLGEAMTRTVHALQLTRKMQDSDAARISARAEWAALRIQFDASSEPNARELYELVGILVERSDLTHEKGLDVVDVVVRSVFSDRASALVRAWVAAPDMNAKFADDLAKKREWKRQSDATRQERAQHLLDQIVREYGDVKIADILDRDVAKGN